MTNLDLALAVNKFIEAETAWGIEKFGRTARRFRTIEVQADQHTITNVA
ncbi:MAG: hypothetical protein ABIQ53_07025 [Terracoccus sp.]